MLRSLKDLEHYSVSATDGDIGSVVNFLLDDVQWAIRYVVISTNGLFDGRQVLVSPISFRDIEWAPRRFHLGLTMAKVKNSPNVDTDKPVSRQHERDYYRYYGYAPYWGRSGLWGMEAYPGLLATQMWCETPLEPTSNSDDAHLRSAREVRGYHVQGIDDAVGHIEDFIVDDETWEIRYLVVDTSNWWFGKKVLVAPHWASRVSWKESKVYVDLSREVIKNCPEWDPAACVNREYETRLYDYYGRPQYWDNSDRAIGTPRPRHSVGNPA